MPVKGGEIAIERCSGLTGLRSIHPIERNNMGGTDKKSEHPKQDDAKPKKPPPPPSPIEEDDFEDGDIATPKRDRCDDDDQPL